MIAREEPATTFARRHIGPSSRDIAAMLETVSAKGPVVGQNGQLGIDSGRVGRWPPLVDLFDLPKKPLRFSPLFVYFIKYFTR